MKKELDEKLCKEFPKIFADRNAPITETCMAWGFECGDGWYNIIYALCRVIQLHIDNQQRIIDYTVKRNEAISRYLKGDTDALLSYAGTEEAARSIVNAGLREVPEPIPQVVATQVKEKYGGLRFYYYGGDATVEGAVFLAELLSELTCEVCGCPAEISSSRDWIQTICEAHAS